MDAVAESGRKEKSPLVSARFSLEADARRGRRNLSRETKFSGANGDQENSFSLFIWPRMATLSVEAQSAKYDDYAYINNNNSRSPR